MVSTSLKGLQRLRLTKKRLFTPITGSDYYLRKSPILAVSEAGVWLMAAVPSLGGQVYFYTV